MESSRSDALFHDPLAAGLAGERGLRIARTRPDGAWVVAIRTGLIDAFIRSAISSGIDTVINLGAGMDTRPYRMDLPRPSTGSRLTIQASSKARMPS